MALRKKFRKPVTLVRPSERVHFIDGRSGNHVEGHLVQKSFQPFTGETVFEIAATDGMTYWVPQHLVTDGVLGVLARL